MEWNVHGCVHARLRTRSMLKEPIGGVNKELESSRDMTDRRRSANAAEEKMCVFFFISLFRDKVYSTVCSERDLAAAPFPDRQSWQRRRRRREKKTQKTKKNPRKRCNKEARMLQEHQFGRFNTGFMVVGNSMFPLVCQRLNSHWLNYIEEVWAERLPVHERRREEIFFGRSALERDCVQKAVWLLINITCLGFLNREQPSACLCCGDTTGWKHTVRCSWYQECE